MTKSLRSIPNISYFYLRRLKTTLNDRPSFSQLVWTNKQSFFNTFLGIIFIFFIISRSPSFSSIPMISLTQSFVFLSPELILNSEHSSSCHNSKTCINLSSSFLIIQISQPYRAMLLTKPFARLTFRFRLMSLDFHSTGRYVVSPVATPNLIVIFISLFPSGVMYDPNNLNLFTFSILSSPILWTVIQCVFASLIRSPWSWSSLATLEILSLVTQLFLVSRKQCWVVSLSDIPQLGLLSLLLYLFFHGDPFLPHDLLTNCIEEESIDIKPHPARHLFLESQPFCSSDSENALCLLTITVTSSWPAM